VAGHGAVEDVVAGLQLRAHLGRVAVADEVALGNLVAVGADRDVVFERCGIGEVDRHLAGAGLERVGVEGERAVLRGGQLEGLCGAARGLGLPGALLLELLRGLAGLGGLGLGLLLLRGRLLVVLLLLLAGVDHSRGRRANHEQHEHRGTAGQGQPGAGKARVAQPDDSDDQRHHDERDPDHEEGGLLHQLPILSPAPRGLTPRSSSSGSRGSP
jgi:hypothetical protein